MKLKVVWTLLVFIPPMKADAVTCNAGAASVPVFSLSSTSGAVGDYTLDCTGGTPAPPSDPVPQIDLTAFMNVPVLNTAGWILTDGVNNTPGTLETGNTIEFLDVPFNPPGSGHLDLQVENIFVNPSVEAPGFEFMETAEITSNFSIGIVSPQQEVAMNAVPEPPILMFLGLSMGAMGFGRKKRLSTLEV